MTCAPSICAGVLKSEKVSGWKVGKGKGHHSRGFLLVGAEADEIVNIWGSVRRFIYNFVKVLGSLLKKSKDEDGRIIGEALRSL